jgi:two-component system, response regulator, stage 0 sporulation protein F
MEISGTILVVDNNEGVCAFLKTAFQDHGFTVFVASSGRKAINLFRDQPIDIVLMDVKMPDLSGPETLEILQSIRSDAPCFFMTAGGGITKEHLKGGIDVFEKPFRSLSEVVTTFSEFLDKRGPIKHPAHSPGGAHLEQKLKQDNA